VKCWVYKNEDKKCWGFAKKFTSLWQSKIFIMGKFVIKKRKDGEYQFNLVAGNGQNILASEGYAAKAGCLNGIESVKTNSQDDSKYDCKTSSNGKHYFNLKAANGQIIGTSEMYEGEAGCKNGVASVKNNAKDAAIEDTTV
jgi:uncharacterized protein YegP (UPF0339 family)